MYFYPYNFDIIVVIIFNTKNNEVIKLLKLSIGMVNIILFHVFVFKFTKYQFIHFTIEREFISYYHIFKYSI